MLAHLSGIRFLAGVVVLGVIGFLYPLASKLDTLNSWEEWNQPQLAATIVRCMISALVAVTAALGISVRALFNTKE